MPNPITHVMIYYLSWDLARKRDYSACCDALTGGRTAPLDPDLYEYTADQIVLFDNAEQVADMLFEEYNIGTHGGRRDIRSMSVGDIVICGREDGTVEVLLCASCGWTRLDPRWADRLANEALNREVKFL